MLGLPKGIPTVGPGWLCANRLSHKAFSPARLGRNMPDTGRFASRHSRDSLRIAARCFAHQPAGHLGPDSGLDGASPTGLRGWKTKGQKIKDIQQVEHPETTGGSLTRHGNTGCSTRAHRSRSGAWEKAGSRPPSPAASAHAETPADLWLTCLRVPGGTPTITLGLLCRPDVVMLRR
jgi:hypothetical protein